LRLTKTRDRLDIAFDDGSRFSLPAEYLRVESPSAEVQGHGGQDKTIVLGKQNVRISDIQPVGNYAVRLVFDDGHDSGLFTWDYFHELGRNHAAKWAAYQAASQK
jgi:DUF971 family protein